MLVNCSIRWHLWILLRSPMFLSFFSLQEQNRLRFLLVDQIVRGSSIHNDFIVMNENQLLDGSSNESNLVRLSHLERWTQWKLNPTHIQRLILAKHKEDVYNMQANTSPNTSIPLVEVFVSNLQFFARGKRSVVYAGELKHTKDPVVVKYGISGNSGSTNSSTLENEVLWLRILNRLGIGSPVRGAGSGWLVCDRIDGQTIVDFLQLKATATTAEWVVREILCQCFILDLMGINKEEMTHPNRHILIHKTKILDDNGCVDVWRCSFIDFEKCVITRKPKNVTQISQFLNSPRIVTLLNKLGIEWDQNKLRQLTKVYKNTLSTSEFTRILQLFKLK